MQINEMKSKDHYIIVSSPPTHHNHRLKPPTVLNLNSFTIFHNALCESAPVSSLVT